MGLEKIASFDKQVEYLLYKLSQDGAQPIGLAELSCWARAQDVPPNKRAWLLKSLEGEMRARERMGDAEYFNTLSLLEKINCYDKALAIMLDKGIDEHREHSRITWAAFRAAVAQTVADAFAQERHERNIEQ
jgi:hypothetical protein